MQSVIDLLGSPEVALDDRHGPRLYARFLSGLLATPMARIDLPSPSRSTKSLPRRKPKSSTRPLRSSESPHTTSNHHSPSSSSSLSPPPTTFGFDQVQFTGEEPSHHASASSSAIDPQNALGMDMTLSDFFQPPLPFDTEMLQSFQSLTDPSAWQDISLPGMLVVIVPVTLMFNHFISYFHRLQLVCYPVSIFSNECTTDLCLPGCLNSPIQKINMIL